MSDTILLCVIALLVVWLFTDHGRAAFSISGAFRSVEGDASSLYNRALSEGSTLVGDARGTLAAMTPEVRSRAAQAGYSVEDVARAAANAGVSGADYLDKVVLGCKTALEEALRYGPEFYQQAANACNSEYDCIKDGLNEARSKGKVSADQLGLDCGAAALI